MLLLWSFTFLIDFTETLLKHFLLGKYEALEMDFYGISSKCFIALEDHMEAIAAHFSTLMLKAAFGKVDRLA